MALTMENSGAALVAGAPLPRKTRRVRVLRPFMLDGTTRTEVDEEHDLPAVLAFEMVAAGKATFLPGQAQEADADAAPTTKPVKPAKESTHARK